MNWQHPFDFSNSNEPDITGVFDLAPPEIFGGEGHSLSAFRKAQLKLTNGKSLDVVLYHNQFTKAFFYLSEVPVDNILRQLYGLPKDQLDSTEYEKQWMQLPGQFIVGSSRTKLVHKAVAGMLKSPIWQNILGDAVLDEVVVFPVLREGAKYGIPEAMAADHNLIVDEVLVDAHHVDDPGIPGYGRRTEISVFKDKDLSDTQRTAMETAVVGDSIASGTVLITVVEALRTRYENLKRIEIIAPFAALRGLARIADQVASDISIRVHAFESVLNALAPDYYWSAHYAHPAFHFNPVLEEEYRAWWGEDDKGAMIADTACAGYGWSESFFNPRMHLRMINQQLSKRHGLSMANIMQRTLNYAE